MIKAKSQEMFGLIPTFGEVTGEKLARWPFCTSLIVNRVKVPAVSVMG